MLTLSTFLGLIFVCGGSTLLGSLPVLYHKYLKDAQWNWWESFGGGVMMAASIFSLFLPAVRMVKDEGSSYWPLAQGVALGLIFIALSAFIIKKLTQNIAHQKAFLFVFVMGLHNIPEGLSVGVDVGALGWAESMHLCVAIFIQNLPEGFASSMSFLISGFSVRNALIANGVTAIIESVSAVAGFKFASSSLLGLPFMLSFAGASMMTVVVSEAIHRRGEVMAAFSVSGFSIGFILCALLDVVL